VGGGGVYVGVEVLVGVGLLVGTAVGVHVAVAVGVSSGGIGSLQPASKIVSKTSSTKNFVRGLL